MDTLNLLVGIVLMLLGATYGMSWMVWGIAAIIVFSERNLQTLILMSATVFVIYSLNTLLAEFIPYILLGIVLLSMLFGGQKQPQQEMGMGLEGLYGGGAGMGPGY